MFSQCNGYSPVSQQDFIWLGEYVDGTHLAEFDFLTHQENSFYSINRENLLRFGLVGRGQKFFAEADGTFKLAGKMVDLVYSTPETEFRLTGNIRYSYNDVITYKDAQASGLANFSSVAIGASGNFSSSITQFNFGYKAMFEIDGVIFHLRAICMIPTNSYDQILKVRLVADKELCGHLKFVVNGLNVYEYDAPLKPNVGGELNWLIQ